MSLHRFFTTEALPEHAEPAWPLPLSERDVHHAARVLRLLPGDRVMLADPAGREAEGTLISVLTGGLVADVGEPREGAGHPRVSLAMGLVRRERMEIALQKATELGVSEIVPVAFSRSVVKLEGEREAGRVERWRRIAEEAAKQSQRADVPLVREPVTVDDLVATCAHYDLVLVPWEEAAGPGVREGVDEAGVEPDGSVLVVIGPEGGMEAGEVESLEAAGGVIVSLGSRVLRSETAAVVAVALATYELGGLGGAPRA